MSAELKMLGRVFEAETHGRSFQSKAAMMKRLEAKGYVEYSEEVIPGDSQCPWPIRIWGWNLTHLGRLTYCESCKEAPR